MENTFRLLSDEIVGMQNPVSWAPVSTSCAKAWRRCGNLARDRALHAGDDTMTTLSTSKTTRLPVWADDIRRRYLRGESTQFVLFGNVHDLILDDPDGQIDKRSADERLLPLPEFLSKVLLEKKSMVILVQRVDGRALCARQAAGGF